MLGPGRWLMLVGAGAVLVGILMRRWAQRHDLREAALDSAWMLLRGRRTAESPTALEGKLKDIQEQPTWTGKASKAARTAAAHGLAQVGQAMALVLIVVGVGLVTAGFIWR